ncbi:aminotransferase class I/II-fold pyridoxal phosphate-dependent enzyme [Owenweeksia hongkongensis]|uniref:aminotransferase class I/II-fold pyridoxal phosphate-dependent enzyme n=1 Tax=Owenweeksia hongkongensis TaxID=253245 RepID=UPI003A90C736
MTKKKQISAPYYNIGQLRVDFWTGLKNETTELARCNNGSANQKSHIKEVKEYLRKLESVESFFAFPGFHRMKSFSQQLEDGRYGELARNVAEDVKQLVSDSYRGNPRFLEEDLLNEQTQHATGNQGVSKTYFEVLFVEEMTEQEELDLRADMAQLRNPNDQFTYGVVVKRSFQDALIALLFNFNIQAVVVRYAPSYYSKGIEPEVKPYIEYVKKLDFSSRPEYELGPILGRLIRQFRPELDAYYVTDTSLGNLKDKTISAFNRIFYRKEDLQEIHLTIMRGIEERYEAPFFSALKKYSQKPTGVFHAMPISRGNSVFKSRWIKDFGDFYGRNMFLAETSATTGGLDSLLQPTGPLKKAQEMASDAYGSKRTFFVTNGTSTANKIVMQALVKPGDVVMIDRDCHKSHHYGLVLSGAFPVYLDSYPIEEYSMYGAVPLEEIKEKLLKLKAAGRLDKVKMLLLTNCTFDGLVYNVQRVMEQVLAIKPDMIFLWDEAWFAFAGFSYLYKQRTGMFVARNLYRKYNSDKYKRFYKQYIKDLPEGECSLYPDPDKVKIRVYSTQSTHKTLSSFRQGSMIHIWDEDFKRKSESTFLEAYMTHTSTSPNYQMLASLDIGRRQVQFEGFELVEKSLELAMVLRAKINDTPELHKYFEVLTIQDFIPEKHRETGIKEYYDKELGWSRIEEAWEKDEFILDPTKITLNIGKTGVDGDTFKNKYLMDKFNIQINKTSRNTVLFMTNIGTTRGSVTYLVNSLLKIAAALDEDIKALSGAEVKIRDARIHSLTCEVPPLPDFSHFHESFQAVPGVPGGNLREAYFLVYNEENYEYIPLDECLEAMALNQVLVASSFVIPYPPGFPVLVPGQVVSVEIIKFLLALDVSEIHGYRADLGLRVFKQSVLDRHKTTTSIGMKQTKGTYKPK